MIQALEDAIAKVRALPPERQTDAADALEMVVKASHKIYVMSPEELVLVDEGLADCDASRIVPDEEIEAFWARHKK